MGSDRRRIPGAHEAKYVSLHQPKTGHANYDVFLYFFCEVYRPWRFKISMQGAMCSSERFPNREHRLWARKTLRPYRIPRKHKTSHSIVRINGMHVWRDRHQKWLPVWWYSRRSLHNSSIDRCIYFMNQHDSFITIEIVIDYKYTASNDKSSYPSSNYWYRMH